MSEETDIRILIVDDDPRNLLAMTAVLQQPGLAIVQAASGEEALKFILKQRFAAILLDVQMPGIDGFETAELIRQRERSRHTPLLFITAVGKEKELVFRGYSSGAVDYIFKPIEPEILRAKVAVFIELHRKTEELELKARELARSNQELEAFSYTVSHDLRAPLRAVTGFAKLLMEKHGERLDTDGQQKLQRIIDASVRMDVLIRDLLEYSRLGRGEMALQPLPLGSVVGEVLDHMGSEIQERRARVQVAEGLPTVRANRTVLAQMLGNLLLNAFKFVVPGQTPEINIWSEARGEFVRLWVGDTGIGIEPQWHERIFGVFERLHPSSEYPGSGIGLAIVRKGAECMGGQCGVVSAPGQGSEFWIELRRA